MNVISKRFTVSENHSKSLILEYFLRLLTKQLFLNFPKFKARTNTLGFLWRET